nr:receptor-like protein 12 isoform X1 [Ipomoea batatas]
MIQLSLTNTELYGVVPNVLNKLHSLEYLDLSLNYLESEKTEDLQFLSHLPNLKTLDLSYNSFSFNFSELSLSCEKVIQVYLSSNWLKGPIPTNYSGAGLLNLSRNKFSGTISFLCTDKFQQARHLDISDNHFSGKIPECLGQYAGNDLQFLNLANNNFFGEIPSSIGYLNHILSLHFGNNGLFGGLPLSLKNCTSLRILDLGENHLTGGIPTWIGESLTKLKVLYLHSNKLKGSIPTSICQLQSIRIIDLSSNNLSGSIPTCFSNYSIAMSQTSDEWFQSFSRIGQSHFNGISTPLHIYYDTELVMWKGRELEYDKNLKFLKVIDLSSNRLAGNIPIDLTNLHELVSLNLSRNHFSGNIAEKIGQLTHLNSLDLSNNRLSGRIPISMANIYFLEYLDLSNNNLCGSIPKGTQLQSFDASKYAGNPQLCGLPTLNVCPEDKILQRSPGTQGNNKHDHWKENIMRMFSIN